MFAIHRAVAYGALLVGGAFGFGDSAQAQPAASPDKDTIVVPTLIADTTAVKPGTTFTVGVLFKISPNWHIYYKNPGENGFATTAKFSVPDSASISDTMYPAPLKFMSPGDALSYGYEGEAMLLAEVNLAKPPADGKLVITANANWLMCSDRCVPNKKTLTLSLPAGDGKPANEAVFAKYKKLIPEKAGKLPDDVKLKTTPSGSSMTYELTITPPAGKQVAAGSEADVATKGHQPFFYPAPEKGYVYESPKIAGKVAQANGLKAYDGPVTITWKTDPEVNTAEPLKRLDGTLVYQTISNGKLDEPVLLEVKQSL